MKNKHKQLYMSIAQTVAKSSYAVKLQVGAVAVKDHRILSIGYNGTPPGSNNSCETIELDGTLTTKPDVIHAEMNAIYKMARDGQSALGADIFITHAPCFECAKAILSVGFKKVWFHNQYRDSSGITLLTTNNVEVEQYEPWT